MSRKITVIGAGNVGATIAYTLSLDDVASDIVLIDINKDKVQGEVMDIVQGTSFREPISVTAGDYADAAGSDIVIITSGVGRKPARPGSTWHRPTSIFSSPSPPRSSSTHPTPCM